MDSKALALTLDGFADHLEQGGTRCENGPKDIAVFREAARILRDVVPLLLAEHEEVGKKKAEDWERRHEWTADGLPYLIGYKYDAAQAALDALEGDK